ncbi:predicted protein [Postia placenta Mad-698-R]|nr:predicted protein [Postia placenta Mad-698-R]
MLLLGATDLLLSITSLCSLWLGFAVPLFGVIPRLWLKSEISTLLRLSATFVAVFSGISYCLILARTKPSHTEYVTFKTYYAWDADMTYVSYLNTATAVMLLVEAMLFCRHLVGIRRKCILHIIFGYLIVPLVVIKLARVGNLACTIFGSEIGHLDSTFSLRPSFWGHPGMNAEWLMQASDHIRGSEDDERGKGIYSVSAAFDGLHLLFWMASSVSDGLITALDKPQTPTPRKIFLGNIARIFHLALTHFWVQFYESD